MGICAASHRDAASRVNLGLVPKENSSGDIRRLGRITKRGDSYLRTLLTQGGRAVLRAANVSKSPPDKLRAWARKVHRSRGHNKAAIAVANKLARIVWAVSTRESEFQSVPAAAIEAPLSCFPSSLPTEAATIPIQLMAYRSDRRGVKPIATLALRGRSK